jgi:hypothetical protein
MKKFLVVLVIFVLVLAACGDGGNSTSNGDANNNNNSENGNGNGKTTLTIKNLSDYSMNPSYGTFDLGQLTRGGEITKEVDDGIRYLEIVIRYDHEYGYGLLYMRVKEAINCEKGRNTQLIITNNTIVTVPGGDKFEEHMDDITGNLKDVIETLINMMGY